MNAIERIFDEDKTARLICPKRTGDNDYSDMTPYVACLLGNIFLRPFDRRFEKDGILIIPNQTFRVVKQLVFTGALQSREYKDYTEYTYYSETSITYMIASIHQQNSTNQPCQS